MTAPRQAARLPAIALVLLAVTACDNPFTSVAPGRNVVMTVQPTTPAAGADGALRLAVPVRIENRGKSSIFLDPCDVALERRYPASWKEVWTPTCTSLALLEVDAGAAIEHDVMVYATPGTPESAWRIPVAGAYRVTLPIGFYRGKPRLQKVPFHSDPFELG